jgi:hypothetical protein
MMVISIASLILCVAPVDVPHRDITIAGIARPVTGEYVSVSRKVQSENAILRLRMNGVTSLYHTTAQRYFNEF